MPKSRTRKTVTRTRLRPTGNPATATARADARAQARLAARHADTSTTGKGESLTGLLADTVHGTPADLAPGLYRHPIRYRLVIALGLLMLVHGSVAMTALLLAMATTGISTTASHVSALVAVVLLAAPAAITLWRRPGSRRWGRHRWLAVIALAYLAGPSYGPTVLAVGNTWALYRAWVIEFPRLPRDASTRRFRIGRRPANETSAVAGPTA